MGSFKETIYLKSPNFIQNVIISIYNVMAYKKRYSKNYNHFLNVYNENGAISYDELKNIQKIKYENFIKYAQNKSSFYNKCFKGIKNPDDINNINKPYTQTKSI